jgi:drug/metabolite transporter superfamily protein YnfA
LAAKYILGVLAAIFLASGALTTARDRTNSRGRTWLIVGGVFALVSVWLFFAVG